MVVRNWFRKNIGAKLSGQGGRSLESVVAEAPLVFSDRDMVVDSFGTVSGKKIPGIRIHREQGQKIGGFLQL